MLLWRIVDLNKVSVTKAKQGQADVSDSELISSIQVERQISSATFFSHVSSTKTIQVSYSALDRDGAHTQRIMVC